MDPFTLALLGGSALASGGLSYMGSQRAAGAQSAAAQQSGMLGLIAQQQAQEQARQMAEQEANQLLQLAGELNSLDEAAKRKHVPAKKSQEFSRIQPDGTLRLQPPTLNEVFLLLPSSPFPMAALAVGNGYLSCQLLSRNGPGPETLSEQRAPTWKKLYEEKQAQIWELWLEQQRQKAGVQLLQKL